MDDAPTTGKLHVSREPTRRDLIEERDEYKRRAQHMGELVEAADAMTDTIQALLNSPKAQLDDPGIRALLLKRWKPLRAILAKIGGGV